MKGQKGKYFPFVFVYHFVVTERLAFGIWHKINQYLQVYLGFSKGAWLNANNFKNFQKQFCPLLIKIIALNINTMNYSKSSIFSYTNTSLSQ